MCVLQRAVWVTSVPVCLSVCVCVVFQVAAAVAHSPSNKPRKPPVLVPLPIPGLVSTKVPDAHPTMRVGAPF